MRLTLTFAALALAAATPALAQNETTYPTNDAAATNAVGTVGTNATAPDANVVTGTPTDPAAAPGTDVATDTAAVDTAAAPSDRTEKRLPWGLIGLIGLIGLLGRRRSAE